MEKGLSETKRVRKNGISAAKVSKEIKRDDLLVDLISLKPQDRSSKHVRYYPLVQSKGDYEELISKIFQVLACG